MSLLASKEEFDYKMGICKQCSYYNSALKLCNKCNCFLPAKLRLPRAECPMHKWDPDRYRLQIVIDHNPHEYKHANQCTESYIS